MPGKPGRATAPALCEAPDRFGPRRWCTKRPGLRWRRAVRKRSKTKRHPGGGQADQSCSPGRRTLALGPIDLVARQSRSARGWRSGQCFPKNTSGNIHAEQDSFGLHGVQRTSIWTTGPTFVISALARLASFLGGNRALSRVRPALSSSDPRKERGESRWKSDQHRHEEKQVDK